MVKNCHFCIFWFKKRVHEGTRWAVIYFSTGNLVDFGQFMGQGLFLAFWGSNRTGDISKFLQDIIINTNSLPNYIVIEDNRAQIDPKMTE